jgi:iron complex outermembrane recepter protein
MSKQLRTTALAAVIAAVLYFPATYAQDTQSTQTTSTNSDQTSSSTNATRLKTVVVSGSLFNDAQIDTATPTYTITAQQMRAQGFNNVSEVLQNSVYSTGQNFSGGSVTNNITPGAQTVNLYGLNPEFTLVLIDGKPLAQFGQLYNGQNNFTNVSNIPVTIVDHIDIMPGGGSSIYGSNAIAGVVNIVLKDHMDGVEVQARSNTYQGGGGGGTVLSAVFGHDFGKLNVLGALEFDHSTPMWSYQRPFTDSSYNNPNGLNIIPTTIAVSDYGVPGSANFTGNQLGYINPPNGCGAVSGLFAGSTVLGNAQNAPVPLAGTYCGSPHQAAYNTLINGNTALNSMLKLKYNVNDSLQIYSDILADFQKQKLANGGSLTTWWETLDSNYFPGEDIVDAKTGHIIQPSYVFAPEEIPGGYNNQLQRQDDLLYQADIGAKGTFGDSNWNWDVYFLRSGDRTNSDTPQRLASAVDQFFINKFLGGGPIGNEGGYNVYNVNYNAFFQPITPAQFNSFSVNVPSSSNTWINNARATISNDSLFPLPGGDAALAFLIESGSQAWYQPVNPLISSGQIWGQSATAGGGERAHKDAAFEWNLPLLKQLTLDVSGRYDYYSIGGGEGSSGASNNKFTYKIGLEYRPFENWLIRGNYTTAFMAPDMASLFLGASTTYSNNPDPYLCAINGNTNCQSYYAQALNQIYSNRDLKPTTATTWSFGTVWSPIENLNLSADFLHLSVQDEIIQQNIPELLSQDSQCLLGQLPANSPTCVAALNQVQRNSLNQVTLITTYYENLSSEQANSVVADARYKFNVGPVGDLAVHFAYQDLLKHTYQLYAGAAPINLLTNNLYDNSTEFKSIATGDLTWSWHDTFSSTLYWHRYGRTPNYIASSEGPTGTGAGWVAPWIYYNWSFTYSPTKNLDLSLMINNLTNKMPPIDRTYTVSPYYNQTAYNVFGREFLLQANYRFGGGHSG